MCKFAILACMPEVISCKKVVGVRQMRVGVRQMAVGACKMDGMVGGTAISLCRFSKCANGVQKFY